MSAIGSLGIGYIYKGMVSGVGKGMQSYSGVYNSETKTFSVQGGANTSEGTYVKTENAILLSGQFNGMEAEGKIVRDPITGQSRLFGKFVV